MSLLCFWYPARHLIGAKGWNLEAPRSSAQVAPHKYFGDSSLLSSQSKWFQSSVDINILHLKIQQHKEVHTDY